MRHAVPTVMRAVKHPTKIFKRGNGLLNKVLAPIRALKKEADLGPLVHADVLAALERMKEKDASVAKLLDKAYGFAVIPSLGRASAVLGGAYGLGEVFEQGRVIGYAAIVQLTIGVQLGGETFHELVVFRDRKALEAFKSGKLAFAANAEVVIVKAGAEAVKGFGGGTTIFVCSEGGLLLNLAIGGQKFIFRPAALGRLRSLGEEKKEEPQEETEAQPQGGEDEAAHHGPSS
jgi:lipid-binding SYLF domain-containing protein